jgi:hypothetical protein
MAIALKVTVSPERISLPPGESADVELTIQNASQVVEHFAATVVGLPSNDLWSCEPEVVKLRPREVGTLRLKIEVPERGGLVAGPYTLGLVVKSPYSQEVSRCEELPLDVQPAPALTMSVQPEVVTGGKVGHYGVSLTNEGNMPMAVTLSGTDPENRVGFKFEPRELRLAPGTAAGANMTVHSDPPLTGQEIRRSMTLRAHSGETVTEKPLTFVQRPRIRGGMMKFGALAAGLAVLGGMTYGGAKVLRDLKTNNTAAASSLPTPTQNPTQGVPTAPQPATTPPATSPPATQPQPTQPQPTNPQNPAAPQPVPVTDNIDFTAGPDNKPVTAEGPIAEDNWANRGLILHNAVDKATFNCRDATQQVIRIVRASTTPNPKNPVQGAGAFLGTARPLNPTTCATLPIRMEFDKPLKAVNVFFTALPQVQYTATLTFVDGTTQDLNAVGTKIGDSVVIPYQVPQGGKLVKWVTFGHSASTPETNSAATMLKGIGYTRE